MELPTTPMRWERRFRLLMMQHTPRAPTKPKVSLDKKKIITTAVTPGLAEILVWAG